MKVYHLALAALLGGASGLPSRRKRSTVGPVLSSNFQDPSIIEVDGTYYAYSGPNGNPDVNVQLATASDFSSFTLQSGVDLLPTVGSWAASTPHVWAPDVNYVNDGYYVLYYAAATSSNSARHCIGAATSDTPDGTFTPLDTELICPIDEGGAIDPDGFVDPVTSLQYIVYKVDGNSIGHGGDCSNSVDPIVATPILLQEVSAADGVTLIGDPVEILTNIASDGPNVEAPSLVYDSSSETYFLFFNSGCYTNTDYTINYATSDSISGPYTRQGAFLATGDTAADVIIPGGIDFVSSDISEAVFHADINKGWLDGDGSARVRALYAIDVTFSDDTATPGSLV